MTTPQGRAGEGKRWIVSVMRADESQFLIEFPTEKDARWFRVMIDLAWTHKLDCARKKRRAK